MAEEKTSMSPEEGLAPESLGPETPGAGSSPPEAEADAPGAADSPAKETPEQGEAAEAAAGEPAAEEHEEQEPPGSEAPAADAPPGETPEAAPAQASLFGEGAPAMDAPAPGGNGEVVVDFDKISELIAQRNAAAREAVEKKAAEGPDDPGHSEVGRETPGAPKAEAAPKRRGRKPKAEKTVEESAPGQGNTDKPPRKGHKAKDVSKDKATPEGKPRDKLELLTKSIITAV